jgi:ABC-2 type transport system ATP-binding protein
MAQIIVEELVKTYQIAERAPGVWGALRGLARRKVRTIRALDGVSFTIGQGELVGYIGPNGAGKSTTVKALAGILVPDGGRCVVDGRVPWRDRIAHVARIGVVFGQRTQLWWDLAVSESFELLRHLYAVPKADFDRRLKRCDEVLGLGEFLATPVRKLSLGQRMKADIAASLLHQPSVLFLDEPTVGVDPALRVQFWSHFRRLAADGRTILVASHVMDEADRCDELLFLRAGKVIARGTGAELRARAGTTDLEAAFLQFAGLDSHGRPLAAA